MKVRPRRGLVLLKWVETKVSQYIYMIDGREGSRGMSLQDGGEDLYALDRGKRRGNVGVVVSIDPRDAADHDLQPGEAVLYAQHSVHEGMSAQDAQRIALAHGEPRGTWYFFVPLDKVDSVLADGIPGAGTVW